MAETQNLYFAYGSNLMKSQMRERCPDSEPIQKAQLRGWKLTFRCRNGEVDKAVANIEPSENGIVHGAVYKISSSKDWETLDRYEGFPSSYNRQKLTTDGGMEVVVYIMTEGSRPNYGKPSGEYENKVRVGFREWNLPEEVLDKAITESTRLAVES